MKTAPLIILFLFLVPFLGFSQNKSEDDSLVIKMCNEFKNTAKLSDSARVENMYSKFLYPYLEKIQPAKIDSTGNAIYFRLQRECEDFRKFLLDRNKSENWTIVDEMPKIEFTKDQKNDFNKLSQFYYFEGETNKITNVEIKNGFWIDEFHDKTYSKNSFTWENDHKFVLEYIESNNQGRRGFSRKGDKYYYSIVNKKANYYLIAAQIPNQKEILLFKLYKK
ncbi:hypothetical protein [Chryseobacterium sp. R2A-55]|uniref:hypothetical protein n=1 Tax=Chryseobacterium sp. R2A-55 TaxID=2744445 RepID=UPI001F3EF3C7|nr:hypothetical protein [Chryseobacterium sp. R2A-55]